MSGTEDRPFVILWVSFSLLFCFLSLVSYFEPTWIATRAVHADDNRPITVDRVATFGVNKKCSDIFASIYGHSESCFGSIEVPDEDEEINQFFFWSTVFAAASVLSVVPILALIILRVCCVQSRWLFIPVSIAHLLSALCFAATVVLYMVGYTKGRDELPDKHYSLFGYCSTLEEFPFREENDPEKYRCSVSWGFVLESFLCLGNLGLSVLALINAVKGPKNREAIGKKKISTDKMNFSSLSSGFNGKSLSLDRDLVTMTKPKRQWKTPSLNFGKLKRGNSLSLKPPEVTNKRKNKTGANLSEVLEIPELSGFGVSNVSGKFRSKTRSPLVSVSQDFDDALRETNEQTENYVIDTGTLKRELEREVEKPEQYRHTNVQIEEF